MLTDAEKSALERAIRLFHQHAGPENLSERFIQSVVDAAALRGLIQRAGWQPIETAPKDGTAIQVRIPGHGEDNIIAWQGGLLDSSGNDCGAWCFVTEQEPPECWTDGWCWEVNEDGAASVQPTHWKPTPPTE
jgi:hypothetical protein